MVHTTILYATIRKIAGKNSYYYMNTHLLLMSYAIPLFFLMMMMLMTTRSVKEHKFTHKLSLVYETQ